MFHHINDRFLDYCHLVNFSEASNQALTSRFKEFKEFCRFKRKRSIKTINYALLAEFVADFRSPSIHVTKSRVWMLHQFYHFLALTEIVPKNIAMGLSYPKIEKTVPQFLTVEEYKRLIAYFSPDADTVQGLRNLIIIMLLGTLGLRTSTLIALDIQDVDIKCGLIRTKEKGGRCRSMVLPYELCRLIQLYLHKHRNRSGPLLLSKRKRRISQRTLQDIFRTAADKLGIDKKLHARLFRHTAATHLNQIAGLTITQHVLGHSWQKNTQRYTHLNPDQYGLYMQKHPYNRKELT